MHQNQFSDTKNQFVATQNHFLIIHPKTFSIQMGYCKKRRRSQRLKDRKNSLNPNIGLPSEDSSLSESSSFQFMVIDNGGNCYDSTVSEHDVYFEEGQDNHRIPESIFLDDQGYHTTVGSHHMTSDTDNEDNELTQMREVEETDLFLNYREDISNTDSYRNPDLNSTTTYSSSSDDDLNNEFPYHLDPINNKDPFDKMTDNDIASYRIMTLLDSVGAPRYCYNKLITLLKKITKNDGFDIKKAVTRETLMTKLASCKDCPRIENKTVCNQEVFRFAFIDMLQDLLNGCDKHLHLILPGGGNLNIIPDSQHHELWNTEWMQNTFKKEEYQDFDLQKDIMLPLILYMDKTGTDVNQRYSLEPVLFTLAAIPREQRESRFSWRHLGFVPQRKYISLEDELDSSLQIYHDFLRFLLDGIESAQKKPPTVQVRLPNGKVVHRRARLPLMIVMGDQLSQDTLCGRVKSNSGGAGRVHRSCMCSYLHVDNPYHDCKKVDIVHLNTLVSEAIKSDETLLDQLNNTPSLSDCSQAAKNTTKGFLIRKRNMFRTILRHPYTMHPLHNAFDDVDFGSWLCGIHDATFDDFMHSVESGMISYITETVYGGLTKKEKESVEEYTRNMFALHRCSSISEFPRMRLQPGFTRQTLLTSGERVGSLLALSLSLQDIRVREVIRSGHARQIEKYLDISSPVATDENQSCVRNKCETTEDDQKLRHSYLKQYMHTLDEVSVKKTIEHMIRHGCNLEFIDQLDIFQLNHVIYYVSEVFKNTEYPKHYPPMNIPEDAMFIDLGKQTRLDPYRTEKVVDALKIRKPEQMLRLLNGRRSVGVVGCTKKHHLRKTNKRGEGSSAAILTSNMATMNIFLEYVLCFHAFCKYSWSLPTFLQTFHDNIRNGNRFVVEYFQKLLYRGNATIDSRFPKLHSQTRMADNILQLNSVMNFCCETGERLLKTEAKGISRTAQQRGDETFLKQTMARLQDRCMLDSFSNYLDQKIMIDKFVDISRHGQDCTGRIFPNFHLHVETDTLTTMDRFGKKRVPDKESGIVDVSILKELKRKYPNASEILIFNEVILRNNNRVRASPNYSQSGPWYDYANISWELDSNSCNTENESVKTYLLPAKCLCFFRVKYREGDTRNDDGDILALIHSADAHSEGKVSGRVDTLLTRNFKLEFEKSNKNPKTDIVSVATIDNPICCYPHSCCDEILSPNSPPITYLLPRNHWAYMWMAMNQCIIESNTPNLMRSRKGLNPLCDQKWLMKVRKTYEKYMNAKSMIDLTNDSH